MTIRKRLAAAGVGIGLAVAPLALIQPQSHADPCFFGSTKFDNWYNGDRWGDTLAHVENVYADGCQGIWHDTTQDWNGHNEMIRVWARSDGYQTHIVFASINNVWHAHDEADTGLGGGTPYRKVCEWPRPAGNSCTPQ